MLTSIMAARLLGTVAFGEFGLVRSTIVMFGVLAGSGLALATTKVVAEYRSTDPARAGRTITLLSNAALMASVLTATLCLLVAPWLATVAMRAPELTTALRLASMLLAVSGTAAVQNGVLIGLEAFRPFSALMLVEGALTLIGVATGATLQGLDGAILGSVVPAAVMLPLRQRSVRARCVTAGIPVAQGGGLTEVHVLWSAAVPAILIGVIGQPFEWLGRLLLARGPDGYAAVGVFTAAYAWAQVVSFAAGQISGPAIPVLANIFAGRDHSGFRRVLRFMGLASLAVTILVVVPIIVLAEPIMRIYGHGFSGGGPVLIAIAAAYGVASLAWLFRSVLVATGRLWTQNLHAVIWGLVLTATFLVARPAGAVGLALAYVAAYGVLLVM